MEVIAYLAAAFIGLSLGLIGGGGAILTVPVLVYLFGIHPLLATSYSLFIVGSTSLIGAIGNYREGQVDLKAAFFFGVASISTVFVIRKFVIPTIPEQLFSIWDYQLSSALATMIVFGLLMLLASMSMITGKQVEVQEQECRNCVKFSKMIGYGIGIGLVTGLLGAGGGFLLIPAMIFLLKLPIKRAIGTSLLVIALNSLTGFAADLGHFNIEWGFLGSITVIAIT
ncbi:sulfite exporter TauE/SafE family protein [Pedobacter panaciterrae]|uniref:Probable membrane transporter protein n=1 Tax=Pedobacter panaciterrae TaxID=363849 RepID=A0ABU8NHL1_9SPHI